MSDKSLVDIAMLMDANVNSIDEAAREMLRSLKEATGEDANLSGDPVSFFFDEVTRIVLDWMATGEIEQVRELLSHIRDVLNDEAEDIYCLDSLSPNNQLTVRLQSLGEFMTIYLKTSNLSKYMGLLVGKRRDAWRKALKWIYEYDQPVRANDLLENGLFTSNSTASNAMNQLTDMGLLDKSKEGQAAVYDLTWAGRGVCKVLPDEIAGIPISTPDKRQLRAPHGIIQFPPELEAKCRGADKIAEGKGLWAEAVRV